MACFMSQPIYMESLRFAVLYFITCTMSSLGQPCPQQCACNGLTEISCAFRNMKELRDSRLPPDMVSLTINFEEHVEINDQSFINLDSANLEALELEGCNIESLSHNSFSHLVNLITLELHDNSIDAIETNGFYGVNKLTVLNLTSNTINDINKDAFNGLSLVTLEFNGNSMPTLTAQMLTGLQVTNIIFKANKLSTLSLSTLEPIRNTVTRITISDNGVILKLEESTFENLNLQLLRITQNSVMQHSFLKQVNTDTLDISKNKFYSTDFYTYPSLVSVQKADLSAIGIEFLSDDKFSSFSGLTELNLSHNEIFILDGDAFKVMPALRVLSVSYNPIIRISRRFGDYLTNLKELHMKGCKLAELKEPSPFSSLNNLQILDLRDNLIQVIDMKMESFLNQLPQDGLELEGNKFHCNCENLWFKQWVTRKGLTGINCVSPMPPVDMRTIDEGDMTCMQPSITNIKGSTDYGTAVQGSGAILEVPFNVSIMLQCSGNGDPAPTLQWYFPPEVHDEVVVEPNMNRTDLITTSYYKLKEIRLDQSGQFKCLAYNSINQTEAYIEVIVRENMTIPTAEPFVPTQNRASNNLVIIIPVAIVVFLLIIILIVVLCKKFNHEHNYHVAEAERLNELTTANGAQNGKPEAQAQLLNVSTDKTNDTQTEL